LGAAVFELGKRGFLFYLGRVANFEAVYGSLSSIIVLWQGHLPAIEQDEEDSL
jgi:uncharacterized BrkB/YihY/UPF0761 family membrane protein